MVDEFRFKKSEEKMAEVQCKKCKAWYAVPCNPFQLNLPKEGMYKCPNCGSILKVGGGSFFVGRTKDEEEKKSSVKKKLI